MLDPASPTADGRAWPGPTGRIPFDPPDGIVVREDGHPVPVDLRALLGDLAGNSFSGLLLVRDAGHRVGALAFFQGLTAHAETPDPGPTGAAALQSLLSQALARPLRLDLRRFTDKFTASFLALVSGRPSQIPSPSAVSEHRESLRAAGFTGCLQVRRAPGEPEAFLFYFGGLPIQTYLREQGGLVANRLGSHAIVGQPGSTARAFGSPSPEQIERDSLVLSLGASQLEVPLEAVSRCLRGLSEVAGPGKAAEYFHRARGLVGDRYPWIEGLSLQDGRLSAADEPMEPMSTAASVQGLLALMDGCWSQARQVFGDRVVRGPLEVQLRDLRPRLAALGFPESWPAPDG